MHVLPTGTDISELAVCLVDDDEVMQDLVSRHIVRLGCKVAVANEPHSAMDVIAAGVHDVVISDLYMPDREDGLNFVADVKAQYPELPVVVMSSEMSQSTESAVLAAGAFACLKKPVSAHDLARVLDKASERYRNASEHTQQHAGGAIG